MKGKATDGSRAIIKVLAEAKQVARRYSTL